MKIPTNRLDYKGETIVEVLIAIAVVSLVLGGAFASTRKSSNGTRTAQERGVALKLAETQIELIKAANSSGNPDIIIAGPFCIASGFRQPDCVNKVGIDYTTVVTHAADSKDYAVKVTWDGLTGATNKVDMVYIAR